MARERRPVTIACESCGTSRVLSTGDRHVQDKIRKFRDEHFGHMVTIEFGPPAAPLPGES